MPNLSKQSKPRFGPALLEQGPHILEQSTYRMQGCSQYCCVVPRVGVLYPKFPLLLQHAACVFDRKRPKSLLYLSSSPLQIKVQEVKGF